MGRKLGMLQLAAPPASDPFRLGAAALGCNLTIEAPETKIENVSLIQPATMEHCHVARL